MTKFGGYELLALLAHSELAEIWLARQAGPLGFEKLVVVKRLNDNLSRDPEYVGLFLDEARVNSQLQHTNVLSVYELGEVGGHYFLAMEYVEGLPLGVFLQRTMERLSDVPIPIAGNIIVQIADGLDYAHDALGPDGAPLRIVHRDLSPVNLLLGWNGIVKIADFAMATHASRRSRTATGDVRGTPTYMSPEHVAGQPLDRRADVFGLGILTWELLTGKRLFRRETPEATYDAIVKGDVAEPSTHRPELSTELDAIVLRALARRPEDRFGTTAAFGKALDRQLRHEGLGCGVTDVRQFLDKHFAMERQEQEQLVARVTQIEVADNTQTIVDPLFARAEHGLSLAAYSDGDTDRDSAAPTMLEPAPDLASKLQQLQAAEKARAKSAPKSPKGRAAPKEATPEAPTRSGIGGTILLILLVLALLGLSMVGGLLLGRSHHHLH